MSRSAAPRRAARTVAEPLARYDDPTLVDLLDRVISRGAVITGGVVLSVADIDLIKLDLKLVITPVDGPGQRS